MLISNLPLQIVPHLHLVILQVFENFTLVKTIKQTDFHVKNHKFIASKSRQATNLKVEASEVIQFPDKNTRHAGNSTRHAASTDHRRMYWR